ncbi:MAG: phospholipid scramblase-related protein, partial [Actinomycetota bacterium]
IKAENWRAWNFSIVDGSDREVGRITKKWEGLMKTAFTTADNYVVEIDPAVQGDMRLLALASAAGIDTALKQDSRGLS